MTNLPVELFMKIFDYLKLGEIIKCRTVCALWREIIDQFVLTELSIFFYKCSELCQWIFDPAFFNSNRLLYFRSRKVTSDERFRFVFRNLRKLFVFQTAPAANDEQFINSFQQLEKLKIANLSIGSLRLPELRTLVTRCYIGKIDCPNLISLNVDKKVCNFFDQNHSWPPIRHLTCSVSFDWIKQFASLETLIIRRLSNVESPAVWLANFPNLKTLDVYQVKQQVLVELANERSLSRNDLNVYYRGLPIEPTGEILSNFDSINQRTLKPRCFDEQTAELYSRHQGQTRSKLQFYSNVIVADPFRAFESNFYAKFPFIVRINVKQQSLAQPELMRILQGFPKFLELILDSVSLDQRFFDAFPVNFPFLVSLYVKENRKAINNIRFIDKLSKLCFFHIFKYRPTKSELDSIYETYQRRKEYLKFA